mgnify:CR=1 FL=1
MALLKIKSIVPELDFDVIFDDNAAEKVTFELINDGWAGAHNYDDSLSVFSATVDKEAVESIFEDISSMQLFKGKISDILRSELRYIQIYIKHEPLQE